MVAAPAPKVKANPEKAYADAVKLFDSGKYKDALDLAKASFDAKRSNEALALVVDCHIKMGKKREAYEWLKEKEPNETAIDWFITFRERWLAEGKARQSVFPAPGMHLA